MSQILNDVYLQCKNCKQCELWKTRTNLVFGRGNDHARIMLVGEAPGKNEDLQGLPFVGAAGQTLEKILATANISIGEIYIANVLKCRPPQNRNPLPDEIAICTKYLDAQIEAINPTVLVALGSFAAQHLLKGIISKTSITRLRGNVYQKDGRYIIPVFHPAATIYDRTKLPVLTHDLCGVRKLADKTIK